MITRLILMKMKIKMKKEHTALDTNTNSKYKKGLIMMTIICIKQHLSHIRNSINEKVKQH